jgi:hypothetical protein
MHLDGYVAAGLIKAAHRPVGGLNSTLRPIVCHTRRTGAVPRVVKFCLDGTKTTSAANRSGPSVYLPLLSALVDAPADVYLRAMISIPRGYGSSSISS